MRDGAPGGERADTAAKEVERMTEPAQTGRPLSAPGEAGFVERRKRKRSCLPLDIAGRNRSFF